ncbi:uncharacterized protein LOC131220671 [Magnolia sinica]|uniref:uncharacterized protein LOC131220671 n=1 Tax=Magnolia sinica TaxID=86752 RepID=UPI00265AF64A|nr:uncharacterized protein LOC131220671 [Magnolia sinica]
MARRVFSCFGRGTPSSIDRLKGAADEPAEEQGRSGPVLVELFLSQGCATSPQAELLLSRLARGDFELDIPVVVLAYHVDYWDYLGWKDPFGSSIWTVRQKAYVESLKLDTLYTPQVVVQGRAHCMGNDEEAMLSAVRSAERFIAPSFQATFERPSPDTLQLSLTGPIRTRVDSKGADIMAALYENGLVTDCTKGENKDRNLNNDAVVRKLEKICTVKDLSSKKTITGTVNFTLWEGFEACKCGVVVFVQNSSLRAFGAQHFQLPEHL